MAGKKSRVSKKEVIKPTTKEEVLKTMGMQMPEEAQKRLKEIKSGVEQFRKEVLKKFDKYISGMALLPPAKKTEQKPGEKPEFDLEKINVFVLVDDSDSRKMSKEELRIKLSSIISSIAAGIDKNLVPQTMLVSELWQNCFEGK